MTAPRILVFDVFGTVVDWHSSIAAEVAAALPAADAGAFALAWRDGYRPAMQRVMSGELPWMRIDELHLLILRDVLARFGADDLPESRIIELNRAWHRLAPWSDAVGGLARLKRRYMVCSLSNGNIGLLADMAKHAGLPWDCILSAEIFGKYKPHPDVYLGAARVFDIAPAEVLMVAAHQEDLAGARACGLRTAYVERPLEFGAARVKDVRDNGLNDLHVRDFNHLADVLGA